MLHIQGQLSNREVKWVILVLELAVSFKLIRGTVVCRVEWSVVRACDVRVRVVVRLLVVPWVVVLPLVRDRARGILRSLILF